jgi:uncharacterized protein YegL
MKHGLLPGIIVTTLLFCSLIFAKTQPQHPKDASPAVTKPQPQQGRGGGFGIQPNARGGSLHIVYLLDVSGSMRAGNKIRKAQEALKQALSELEKTDTFNIVSFAGTPERLAPKMLPATRENVAKAVRYIDDIQLRDGTNLSAAMEVALSLEKITHVFLMSDGEPHGGITDPVQLRTFITEQNKQRAAIITLALVLTEDGWGFKVLKQIAEVNNGSFAFVNLGRSFRVSPMAKAVLTTATPQNLPQSPQSADAIKAQMQYEGESEKLNAEYAKKLNGLREQYIKDLDVVRKKALEKEDLDEAQRLLEEKRRIETERPQPGMTKGFVILCAMIGLEDKWIDMTSLLRKEVKNSRLYMRPDMPNPALAMPDLAPGRHKSLMIAYTFDGKPYLSLTRDDEVVDLPLRK